MQGRQPKPRCALRLTLLAEAASVRVEAAHLDRGERRQELEVPAGRQPAQPVEQAHLRHERVAPRHRRPDDGLVLAADRADHLEPPTVTVAGRVAQALERNRHLGGNGNGNGGGNGKGNGKGN